MLIKIQQPRDDAQKRTAAVGVKGVRQLIPIAFDNKKGGIL